jgi:hypothetical protein
MKVRLLAPANYKDEPVAAGAVVDVDQETFHLWRSSGMASAVDDEEAQAKAAQEGGTYTALTGRAETEGGARSRRAAAKEADGDK